VISRPPNTTDTPLIPSRPMMSDFDSMFIVSDDGHDAALREIHVLNTFVTPDQLPANRKVNGLKVRFKQAEMGTR
jgi:hypothetical protein